MRTYTPEMQAHIAQRTTTLATCLRVERLDGLVLAVTAFNRALSIDALRYEPFGFINKDMTSDSDMGVGTTEVDGILQSASITEDELRAGLWDFFAWEKFQVNWADLTMGRIELGSGNAGVCRVGRLQFIAELLGLMQAVQISIGNLNSPACIHELGDHNASPSTGNGCTVLLEGGSPNFTRYGTVEAMESDYYGIVDSARTEPSGTFSNGKFTILPTSPPGLMDNMSFEIRGYVRDGSPLAGRWVLFTAVPYDVTGLDYKITFGCDKSLRTCIDVFGNILDRLASDYTQGNDAALQVARHNG